MDELPIHLGEELRRLASVGATDRDICEYLGLAESELEKEFSELMIHARAARRISLHKKQTVLAIDGNASMLSFLGKHELGQTQTPAADDDWPEPRLGPKVG
jgi:hypothetical protein